MDNLNFSEIENWAQFEDLAADYFRAVQKEKSFNIIDVDVKQTGSGADGGRDILVKFRIDDSIKPFERKWVVQCKFHDAAVGKKHISDVNIPTLIHEYAADGYLLICKNRLTSQLTTTIDNLNTNCRSKYAYQYWNGTNFLNHIRVKPELIANYFPKHQRFLEERTNRLVNLQH